MPATRILGSICDEILSTVRVSLVSIENGPKYSLRSQNTSVGHVRELKMWFALEFWSKNWYRVALDTSKEIGFGTFWIAVSSFEKTGAVGWPPWFHHWSTVLSALCKGAPTGIFEVSLRQIDVPECPRVVKRSEKYFSMVIIYLQEYGDACGWFPIDSEQYGPLQQAKTMKSAKKC